MPGRDISGFSRSVKVIPVWNIHVRLPSTRTIVSMEMLPFSIRFCISASEALKAGLSGGEESGTLRLS